MSQIDKLFTRFVCKTTGMNFLSLNVLLFMNHLLSCLTTVKTVSLNYHSFQGIPALDPPNHPGIWPERYSSESKKKTFQVEYFLFDQFDQRLMVLI
jgi:hypothetical protein